MQLIDRGADAPVKQPGRRRRQALALAGVIVVVAGGGALPASADIGTGTDLELRAELASVSTGSAPFDADDAPGHDSDRANAILRTHDTVEYSYEIGLHGAAEGDAVTLRQVLPEGLVWPGRSDLPGYCAAGSSVSDDRRTVECRVTGMVPNGVRTVPLVATLSGSLPQGTRLLAEVHAVSVVAVDTSGAEVVAHVTPPPLVVSGAPRVNVGVARSGVQNNATGPDGSPGWLITHSAYLSITGFSSDGGRGARGQASVSGDVTFDLDLSAYPDGSVFGSKSGQGCRVGAADDNRFPGPSGGGPRAVTHSGAWECVVSPDDPKRVSVTVSGADLSADHVPSQTASGVEIRLNGYLAVANFMIFVPYTAVPPSEPTTAVLDVVGLTAHGSDADGAPLPNAPEPLADNTATTNLVRIEGTSSHSTAYVDQAAERGIVAGQSVIGAGDGPVVPGQEFQQRIGWTNTSTDGVLSEAIMCHAFDPKTQRVASRTGARAPVAIDASGGGISVRDVVVEYGTKTVVDAEAPRDERQAQLDAATCGDDEDTWTTDWKGLDLDDITRVRVRPTSGDFPAGATLRSWTNLRLLKSAELGKPVTATYSIRSSAYGEDRESATEYVKDGWWHGVYRSSAINEDFPRGDQLVVASAVVGVDKRAVDPVAEPGSPVQIEAGQPVRFEVKPEILSPPSLGDRANRVVIIDSLPAPLRFVPESASHEPSEIVAQPDGSTLIRWEFSSIRRGDEPVIAYTADSDVFTVGDAVNRVIVGSSDDPSSLSDFPAEQNSLNPHYALQTVTMSAVTGLRVAKEVDRLAAEPGDPIGYTVTFANMGVDTEQLGVRTIDVLPFVGDGRGSTGSAPLAQAAAVSGDALVSYTHADAAAVLANAQADGDDTEFGALPDGFQWCAIEAFGTAGCPSDLRSVTALLVSDDVVPAGERIELTYALDTAGSVSGDRLANNAVAGSDTQTMRSRSELVATIIVTSTVGKLLWWDDDADGVANDADGVGGVTLTLLGTDKFGAEVRRTTTSASDGSYAFSGLVSGTYRIEVPLPEGASGTTTFRTGDDDESNSAVVAETASMEDIVLADPTPTLQDGLDERWNGGFLRATDPVGPGGPGETVQPGALAATGAGMAALLLAVAIGMLATGGLTRTLRRGGPSLRL